MNLVMETDRASNERVTLGTFSRAKALTAPALSWIFWIILLLSHLFLEPGITDSVGAGPFWKWILFKSWFNLIHFQYTCHQNNLKNIFSFTNYIISRDIKTKQNKNQYIHLRKMSTSKIFKYLLNIK